MDGLNGKLISRVVIISLPIVLSFIFLIHELADPEWLHVLFGVLLVAATTVMSLYEFKSWKLIRDDHIREKIASVAFESNEAILIADASMMVLDVNMAFCKITEHDRHEVVGKKAAMLDPERLDAQFLEEIWPSVQKAGYWTGDVLGKKKSETAYIKRMFITAIKNNCGNIVNYVVKFNDVTEQNRAENEIKRLAFTDVLTGLPNRRKLQDSLFNALISSEITGQHGALIFLDMDNFKNVNDSYGHDVGDAFLVETAKRLLSCVRSCDIVARMGGDEFVVLIDGISGTVNDTNNIASIVGRKIISAFERPILFDNKEFSTSPSVGVATFHGNSKSAGDLLKQADSAMYASKTEGKNRVSFFTNEMTEKAKLRFEIESNLRNAVNGNEMELYFQPIVNHSGDIFGAEALLRWWSNGKMISPINFIPIAEETGMIIPVGMWALRSACDQVKAWERENILTRDFVVSVNISPIQLCRADFVEMVTSVIADSGVEAYRVKLEITESSIIKNVDDAIIKINLLRQFGVEVVMDDFGTGYSSLSCLRRLPISQIKIDKSFVDNIENNWDDEAIVRIIASLGRALRVSVLAEGVENERQCRMLEMAGCSLFQGYFFGRPEPAAEFRKRLLGAQKMAA